MLECVCAFVFACAGAGGSRACLGLREAFRDLAPGRVGHAKEEDLHALTPLRSSLDASLCFIESYRDSHLECEYIYGIGSYVFVVQY